MQISFYHLAYLSYYCLSVIPGSLPPIILRQYAGLAESERGDGKICLPFAVTGLYQIRQRLQPASFNLSWSWGNELALPLAGKGKANPVVSACFLLVFASACIDSDDVARVDEERNLDGYPSLQRG